MWGAGETVDAETARVQAAGGWVADGRVCDVLAVSRAFGDREFKGEGLPRMMERGVKCALTLLVALSVVSAGEGLPCMMKRGVECSVMCSHRALSGMVPIKTC